MPGNALISSYLSGLRRLRPASLAEEVSDGLIEAYQLHLARRNGDRRSAGHPGGHRHAQ